MKALGIYHARSCRDAVSLGYDGQEFFDFATLDSHGGPTAEVRFRDGVWKLCDPVADVHPQFTLNDDPSRTFPAISYGEEWNGWATPVVDRPTCEAILAAADEPHRWEGEHVWLDGDQTPLAPTPEGHYDLASWGWTFVESTRWL